MQRAGRQHAQAGRRSGVCASLIAVALLLAMAFLSRAAAAAESCAQVVSIQGTVEILRAGQPAWARVQRLDTQLCEGDRLRTGALSRAALLIAPSALIRVEQNTELALRVRPEVTQVEFSSGAVYSISRFPRRFRILTPFVNAVVEGTEFLVALGRERAEVAVYEGRVTTEDLVGERGAQRRVESGEIARFARGAAAVVTTLVNPTDAVQWALYYPPLEPEARPAGRFLRLGRVDRAEEELKQLPPDEPYALAIGSLIRVVKNDKAGALELANRAVARDARSAPAHIALSYAEQAHFRLEEALAAATRAADLEAGNSVAQARRAELLLSAGRIREAEAAASHAVQANPADSRARTVLGFAHLARLDTHRARGELTEAAALDPSDPLPRLGLGLATIKDGRLAEGRSELEVAVALDPQNALLRSYLGKAYADEHRNVLAEGQLGRAKELDPRDPTAWYYNAIRLQAINRPGEALEELQESITRNENRAVYRSRLLLDQDQAARSASLAHIYSDLGFRELALSEAMRGLNVDPRNFAAHRFLAEAYLPLPRYEIARVSEHLQSQLLQPAVAAVLAPRLGETRIPVPHGAGPITPSFHEFNPLFSRDGPLFSLGAVLGEQDTIGDEALLAYRWGSRTIQLGQFYYDTAGHRPNADLRQKLYSLLYQDDVSLRTSWQFEGRTSRVDSGDVRLQFDPESFATNERNRTDTDSLRLGLRYTPDPGRTWLFALSRVDIGGDTVARQLFPGLTVDFTIQESVRAENAELQYLGRHGFGDFVAGGGNVRQRDKSTTVVIFTLDPFPPDPPMEDAVSSRARHSNLYAYSLLRLWGRSTLTLGLALDDFDDELRFSQTRVSPKLGLVVPVGAGTTLRAAAFRTVKRLLPANQTLEPTQVAGFNQLFDDVNQSRSERLGLGIDQRFSRRLFAGIELTRRKLEVPILGMDSRLARFDPEDEHAYRAYLSALLARNVGASAEYYYERRERERPPASGAVFPLRSTEHHLPLTLTYHHASGFFGALRATRVEQTLAFSDPLGGVTTGETDFWIADASVGMRLPRRLGSVSFDVLNLFDKEFRYHDTDFLGKPRVPLFQPRRLALFRVRINL